jgi:DNA modification methylase
MDNLELMKCLPDNYIDLIYCDILYNTGKKFKNYDDNLGSCEKAIDWYEPRIKEMYRILKNTGTIYIQCDWHLNKYIGILLDKIFGIKNFRNEIIWHYNRWTSNSKDFQR